MADFKFDAKPLLELYRARKDIMCRKLALAVGTSLVIKSPVGDPSLWKDKPPAGYVGGRFRANWQHGVDEEPAGTTEKVDPTGSTVIGELQSSVEGAAAAGLHYLVNNLPYGRKLEYDGHSSQAPAGMVGLTAAEFEVYVQNAVAQARQKAKL
jgi:hypothetical protein